MDEPIFICDPPPGIRWVIRSPRHLSSEQCSRLKAAWESLARAPGASTTIILDDGITIEPLPGAYEWPDAEFCAA